MKSRCGGLRRSLPLALAAILGALLAAAPEAFAHAVVQGSTPERGATVPEQPGRVVLRFSEPVEGNFGAVRVFDARARRVDHGRTTRPGGRGPELAVGLKPDLPDGTYVATYRVISADGHPVSGGLVFSVGAPGATAAPTVAELIDGADAGPVTETAFGAARGLSHLATALALGGLAFLLAVWLPALRVAAGAGEAWRAASAAFLARARALLLGAAALGAAAGLAGLVLQGATAGATTAWAALDPGVLGDVLGTRFGRVWGLRIVAFALLGGALLVLLRGAPRRAPAPALAALPAGYLAFAPALGGHAGVTSPVAVLTGLDVAHVIAMSAWVGGLAFLLAALPAATPRLDPPERSRLLAAVLVRFSPVALGCVAMLLVTGTIQAAVHIGAWSAVLDTGFGRAVAVKAGLLAILVAIGAVNRARVVPALRRLAAGAAAPGAAGHLLRRTLRAEVALLVAVLGVTGALVGYPPPDSLAGGAFGGSAALGPLRVEVTVDPARVGPNEAHLYLLRGSDGTPFDGTKELTVTLALPSEGIGPLTARARAAGPGHYAIDTVELVPAGDWKLRVASRVSEFDAYETTLTVPVR